MKTQYLIYGAIALIAIYVIFKLRAPSPEVVTVPSYFPVGSTQSAGDASAARDSARVAAFSTLGDIFRDLTQTEAQLEATRLETESQRLATAGQLALERFRIPIEADTARLQLNNQLQQYREDLSLRYFQQAQTLQALQSASYSRSMAGGFGGWGFNLPFGAVPPWMYGTPPYVPQDGGGPGVGDIFRGIGRTIGGLFGLGGLF